MVFDWISFLDDHGIEYVVHGQHHHATRNMVCNIHCPFIPANNFHLGVNDSTCSCWACGKHNMQEVISELSGLSGHALTKVMARYRGGLERGSQGKSRRLETVSKVKQHTVELTEQHQRYLTERGFNPILLKSKYQIASIPKFGEYADRIYIPVIENGKVISFTARALNEKPKYKHCSDQRSVVPIPETLYGLDNCIFTHVVLCEGVTDVWRLGENAVAMYGKALSDKQLLKLMKRFKNIFIALDPDAQDKVEQIYQKIRPYRNAYKVFLKDKDPGEFNPTEISVFWNLIHTKLGGEL